MGLQFYDPLKRSTGIAADIAIEALLSLCPFRNAVSNANAAIKLREACNLYTLACMMSGNILLTA